jgi:hypothetical protein
VATSAASLVAASNPDPTDESLSPLAVAPLPFGTPLVPGAPETFTCPLLAAVPDCAKPAADPLAFDAPEDEPALVAFEFEPLEPSVTAERELPQAHARSSATDPRRRTDVRQGPIDRTCGEWKAQPYRITAVPRDDTDRDCRNALPETFVGHVRRPEGPEQGVGRSITPFRRSGKYFLRLDACSGWVHETESNWSRACICGDLIRSGRVRRASRFRWRWSGYLRRQGAR